MQTDPREALIALDLDWPSLIRGSMLEAQVLDVAACSGREAGIAYAAVAWIAEQELSDGRGGSELHTTAEELLALLDPPARP